MNEHIKMPDIAPLVRFLANGTQVDFTFAFPIFAATDIVVRFDGVRQYSGFAVTGAGQVSGGAVRFSAPPAAGVVVTVERRVPLARVTDFLEGGDFSARAINNELDYMMAAVQQIARDQSGVLRYSDEETAPQSRLPLRAARAGKALGFDGDGNPVPVTIEGGAGASEFTASGSGAITRAGADKMGERISVKDYGAKGDGLTNDTLAFQKTMAAHDAVFVPEGTYIISAPLVLRSGQSLIGAGQASILQAASDDFTVLEVTANRITLRDLRIEGGNVAIKLFGREMECTQNSISDIHIYEPVTGIVLDGYDNTERPCYWNNFSRILIERPSLHGVHLLRTGAGDTPNANKFMAVRVYSKGALSTGAGFYVEDGALNNAFVDCEANVNGASADACFRVGAGSSRTFIVNFLAESGNGVNNIVLEDGSEETAIVNLTAMSDGAAIADFSGGNYNAVNAGYPESTRLRKTIVTELTAKLVRYDTQFISDPGTVDVDLTHTTLIVNSTMGAITLRLPAASVAQGAEITVKKVDATENIVTITEADGAGPDGHDLLLGGQHDYVTMVSNGAFWFVKASNRLKNFARYTNTTGTYQIDMSCDTYLISSWDGAVTAQLPPANAAKAWGRKVTIKKTDPSANAVTVTEQGGNGPDQSWIVLDSQHEAVTVMSNGAFWYVLSRLA